MNVIFVFIRVVRLCCCLKVVINSCHRTVFKLKTLRFLTLERIGAFARVPFLLTELLLLWYSWRSKVSSCLYLLRHRSYG